MPGNTTRRHASNDRRSNKRVSVLFSAVLTRRGWRSQIVEVLDLSETGCKVQVRFEAPLGTDVTLKMPGPRRKLEVPCVVMNAGEEFGLPICGLRFRVTEEMRGELKEIVERVEKMRNGDAPPAEPAKGNTRVTRNFGKRRSAPGSEPPPDSGKA